MTEPKTKYVHARIPPDLLKAAQTYAQEDDRTISFVFRKALETFLRDRGYLS